MSRPKMPGRLTGSGRIKWASMNAGPGAPGYPRTTTPSSTSKSVKAETVIGGWGSGLGNNVSNTQRGVNGEADRMAEEMDQTAAERQDKYARLRRTDAYKLQRAAAKRRKRSAFKAPSDATADRDVPMKPVRDYGPRRPTIPTFVAPDVDTWGQRTSGFLSKRK